MEIHEAVKAYKNKEITWIKLGSALLEFRKKTGAGWSERLDKIGIACTTSRDIIHSYMFIRTKAPQYLEAENIKFSYNSIAYLSRIYSTVEPFYYEKLTNRVLIGELNKTSLQKIIDSKAPVPNKLGFHANALSHAMSLADAFADQILGDPELLQEARKSDIGQMCHKLSVKMERIFSEKFNNQYAERRTIEV